MIAAIAGDIVGSVHERARTKRMDFPLFHPDSRFTDDSVMTLAVADCLLHDKPYAATLRAYGRRYPDRGYGGLFREWLASDDMGPYQSFGNGSAMRVSPVGYAFHELSEVMAEAARSAAVTHDHPDGIKGAQAVAVAVFLARTGASKDDIRTRVEALFGYDLHRRIDEIRPSYAFDATCPGSVPEAIIAFLDSTGVEHAIRLGVSLGGDADTIASIAGAIAQAHYKKVPAILVEKVKALLDPELWALTTAFCERYEVAS